MMKPLRAAAVIKTDHGLMIGGDSYKDWDRDEVLKELEARRLNAIGRNKRSQANRFLLAKSLVQEQGRLSLIGGTVDPGDYQNAGIDRPFDAESSHFSKDLEVIMRVIRIAVAREVDEELALAVDPDSIQFIKRIISKNRVHIICTVYAQGKVKMNRAEILGLGMMTDKLPAIPQNNYFYQQHAIQFQSSYLNNPDEYDQVKKMPVSKLNISTKMVQDLYKHQSAGYTYAHGSNRFKEREIPTMLKSTPNFVIYDERGIPQPKNEIVPLDLITKETPFEELIKEATRSINLRKATALPLIESQNQPRKASSGRKR